MKKPILLILLCCLLEAAVLNAQDEGAVREVILENTAAATVAGLGDVVGRAFIYSQDGVVLIHLRPGRMPLPAGIVLEGWLVDDGLLGALGTSDARVADQVYGAPFADLALDVLVSAAPYALSTGLLTEDTEGNWSLEFHSANYSLTPYDTVVVTAEADGNRGAWDPRPGTPFFVGAIAGGALAPSIERLGMVGPAVALPQYVPREIKLVATPLAAAAGLGNMTGQATLYAGGESRVRFQIEGNGASIETCLVLEGWLVDAGRFGGSGLSHASDSDEALGVAFSNERMAAAVEAAPYALSVGVAAEDGRGGWGAETHFPAYNFAPYETFMVTLESDCNAGSFDPRPGTPVLIGRIDE